MILKIFYKDKDGKYPFYLNSEDNVKEFDLELSPENISKVMDDTEKFLQEKGFDRKTINRILFIIEESGMLISEKNQGKKILAEYTILIKHDKIKTSVRDNGKIFNITEEDAEITSFGSYVFSLASPKMFRQRKYLTVTSLNRNIFYQEAAFNL